MQLKVRVSNWSTGLPVVMLNKKTAQKIGVHPGERVMLKTIGNNPSQMASILDTISIKVKEDEIAVSNDVKKSLSLKESQRVQVILSKNPESVDYIKQKLMGKELSKEKIKAIIKDVVNNTLSEPEVAVFVSAMYKNGMTFEETTHLIDAILFSGRTMKFRSKYVVDKHCIGGIAGNRTTPIVVSICAAAGLIFPKTSSRAITSAAGTADCIEVLANVEFSMAELEKIVKKTGACLTWGGSVGMVPADSKIIKVEKMLKLDPEAQLLASIMSKKLAAGSKYILIDIPYGKRAKVSKKRAKPLKRKFEKLGKHFGVVLKVVLTKANEPIGNGVGPALEIIDVMQVLNPEKDGPKDLEEKAIYLSSILLELTGKAKKGKGEKLAKEILDSGKAYKKFKEIIKAQKGKTTEPKLNSKSKDIFSIKKGKIKEIHNQKINYLARLAGCPMDKFSGVYLHHHVGDKVKKGDKLLTIYAQSSPRLNEAVKYYEEKKPIIL